MPSFNPEDPSVERSLPVSRRESARWLAAARSIQKPRIAYPEWECSIVYVALLEGVPRDPPFSLYVGYASGQATEPDAAGRYPCIWRIADARRYRDHKRDHKDGKGWVRHWGIGLIPSLYEHLNPMSDRVRRIVEPSLADALRSTGAAVHQA